MSNEKKAMERFCGDVEKANSEQSLDNAVIHLMHVWDSINELDSLGGMLRLVAYLTSPLCLKEDHDFEVFYEFLAGLSSRHDEAVNKLNEARKKVTFIKN